MADPDMDTVERFDAVDNAIRLGVLRALVNAYAEDPWDAWVSYSDLRSAVGVRDSGNFNYHLRQLNGLIERAEHGYRIAPAGLRLVSRVVSAEGDPEYEGGPVEVPGRCHACGDALRLTYDDGVLRVTCGTVDHDRRLSVPPALLEAADDDEIAERIAVERNDYGRYLRNGICPSCRGSVTGAVERHPVESDRFHYSGRCRRCGSPHGVWIGDYLLAHPAVVAFYWDHGVDVRSTPHWTLPFCDPGREEVVSTDPLRLRVDVVHDGDTLTVTVDESGRVTDSERR